MKVSVVIPCYNAAAYISATIHSVLAQQGVELEVIVVDDGSTDGSAALVHERFPEVTLLQQSNQGVSRARNAGIAHSRGDWVAFVDADDIWLPGKLAAQLERLRECPQARMAYTAWYVWPSETAEPDAALVQRLLDEPDGGCWGGSSGDIYPALLLDCVVWTSTVLVRRDLLTELGGFDPTMSIGEDYDLWLRASRVTAIVQVPRPLALYRMHPSNTTKRLPRTNHKGEVIERALQRWGYRSAAGVAAPRADVARGLSRSWSDFAGAHLAGGSPAVARRAAWRAVRTDPRQWLGWKVLLKSLLFPLVPGQ